MTSDGEAVGHSGDIVANTAKPGRFAFATLPAPRLASLTMVASQLLNLDEALMKR